MIFSKKQIDELIGIVEDFHLIFIAENVGKDLLTSDERKILKNYGINFSDLPNDSIYDHSFKFGVLSEALGDDSVKNMSYKDFKKYLKSGKFAPLTKMEQFALDSVKHQTYNDIKGLGNKVSKDFANIYIEQNKNQRKFYEDIIREEVEEGILKRKTIKEVSTRLGERTKDWSRDFDRIADYTMHHAYENGRVSSILRVFGDKAQVYFDVYQGACKHCRKLYLLPNDKPKIFPLWKIISNGSNIGRKTKDWKACVPPMHPHSLTEGRTAVLTDEGYKAIKNINIGDYVLTHKGRFKKVTGVIKGYKVKSDYNIKKKFKIYFTLNASRESDKNKYLSLTAEHKVLTQRGWVQVQNLKIEDSLIKIMKPCSNKNCSEYLDACISGKSCCSKSCMFEHRNQYMSEKWSEEGGFLKDESKLKISEKVSQNWEDGAHKNTLIALKSEKRIEESRRRLNTDGLALEMCKKAGFDITSKEQIKLFKKVKSAYPKAVLEYSIFGKSLDIAIPELKIDIEYDGKYWHEGREEKDAERDDLLKSNGWHVLRYSNQPRIKKLLEDIELVANNSSGSYKLRKLKIDKIIELDLKTGTKLWDIEVEDDHSFVSRGVVIHNCRCSLNHLPTGFEWDEKTQDYTKPVRDDKNIKRTSKVKIDISL